MQLQASRRTLITQKHKRSECKLTLELSTAETETSTSETDKCTDFVGFAEALSNKLSSRLITLSGFVLPIGKLPNH
jgi:hypothetical protein